MFYRFNEAPACLPGKWPASLPAPKRPDRGFNEAPACLPGKCGPGERFDALALGFNEAPACLPGKSRRSGVTFRGVISLQ